MYALRPSLPSNITSETEDIVIGASRRAREGRENDKIIDIFSDSDEPEINFVKEAKRLVPGVVWRTRLSVLRFVKILVRAAYFDNNEDVIKEQYQFG